MVGGIAGLQYTSTSATFQVFICKLLKLRVEIPTYIRSARERGIALYGFHLSVQSAAQLQKVSLASDAAFEEEASLL